MIGQSQVTEPLMTALRSGKVGHAYLFSGPRGCGKTTSARVLARCLNCAEGPTDVPCGTCPSCVELSRDGGGSLDVIEIDAASHGGVDDARDLRERAIFAPVRDRYKVFIIDEAHMVTKEGFNALLKIVEEPPEHVKFVFATTEPEKVIGTIRSRTHHYPFRLIAPASLLEYVQQLCAEEKITVDDGVLPLVIRAGGGSARDTLSILDQLIAGSEGSHIAYERAVGLLGYTHEDILDDVINAVADHDASAGVRAVDRVIQTGQDPRRFVEDLLERFRDLIIVQATDIDGASAILRGVPEEQLQRMAAQATRFPRGSLSKIADTVSDALDNMAGATAPRLHLELMVARVLVESGKAETESSHAPRIVPASAPRNAEEGQPVQSRPVPATVAAPQRVETAVPAEPATTPTPGAPTVTPASQTQHSRPAVSAAPGHTSTSGTIDPAAALRNARAFLAGADALSESQRTSSPLAPAPTQGTQAQEEPPPTPSGEGNAQPTNAEPGSSQIFDTESVQTAWPELSTALGARNSEAGETARAAEVIGVDGVMLHLGFVNDAHLDRFKSLCAAIIRSGFQERFGVTVQYKPWVGAVRIADAKQLFGGPAPILQETPAAEPPVTASPMSEPSLDEPPIEEPPAPDPYEHEEYAGPDHSGSASAGDGHSARDSAPSVDSVPSPDSPPSAPSPPSPLSPPSAPSVPSAPSAPPAPSAPSPPTGSEQRSAPTFTRYGEAVVREVLGAKFIGEQPLP